MLVDINMSRTSISHQPDYSVSSLNLSDLQVGKSLIRFSIVKATSIQPDDSGDYTCQPAGLAKVRNRKIKTSKQFVLTCRPQSLSMFCLQKRNRNGLWKNQRIINQGRKFLSGIWCFHVVHSSSIPCFRKNKYFNRAKQMFEECYLN